MIRRILLFLALLALISTPLIAQTRAERIEESQEKEAKAEELYTLGEYEACRVLLESYFEEAFSGQGYFPKYVLARLYRLQALVTYAFRDEGYREQVDHLLLRAVELDLNLKIGSSSEVPPYIVERFAIIQEEYLSQYSRTARRHSLGVYGALVLESTVIQNPGLLQPGLHYSLNLSSTLTFSFDVRFPLQLPIWNSIRGRVGLIWVPAYRIERINMGLSFSYLFGLDELTTYTHSISFSGNGELVSRSGLGIGASAQLLRLDLILGLTDPAELPSYTTINIFEESFLKLVFANINFYIFYNF